MFKDYDKYLSTSLKVYLFVLIIIFIMKMVGLDYFGIDVNNNMLNNINTVIEKHWYLRDLINLTTLTIQLYLYLCIVCKRKNLYWYAITGGIVNLLSQIILMQFFKMDWIYTIISICITITFPIIINKKISVKRIIAYILLINLYQLISMFVRNVGVNSNYGNFIVDSILNIDQLLMLLINYKIVFMKGDVKKWICIGKKSKN